MSHQIAKSLPFFLSACLLAVGATLASPPQNASDSTSAAQAGAAAPKLLPSEYRALATILALPMSTGASQQLSTKKVSDVIAQTQAVVMDLRQIHSSDEGINQVATMGAAAVDDLTKQIEALDVTSMSKPQSGSVPIAGTLVSTAIAVYTGDPLPLLRAFSQLATTQEQQNEKNETWKQSARPLLAHVVDDSSKLEAAASLLPKIAAQYSAPMEANNTKIEARFVKAWGPLSKDALELINPGPELDDCTVTVALSGDKGESHTNVHFVPKWEAKTSLFALYSQGENVLGQTWNRTTVNGVQSVIVVIQSPKLSTDLSCSFNPQEQDKVVAELCKNLKLAGTYTEKKIFLSPSTYAASITLSGVAAIPRGTIFLTIRQGNRSKNFQFSFASWKNGETKLFPGFPFNPDHTDIAVTFPDTGYHYNVSWGK